MNCTKVVSLLSEWLDGDLDKLIQKQLEHHLSKCSSCQKELSLLSKSLKILRAADIMKPHN